MGKKAGVSHRSRGAVASRYPVHVTLRLEKGLPSLRVKATHRVLRDVFREAKERLGMRIVHYSVQSNHVHLLVEATGRPALSRAMQGLTIRMAKRLNRLWERVGRVFSDRYHDHVLKTPTEVRHAISYVLNNARKHGRKLKELLDPFASGLWFDGWKEGAPYRTEDEDHFAPVADARTWLLNAGWRRSRRPISFQEVPRAPARHPRRSHSPGGSCLGCDRRG